MAHFGSQRKSTDLSSGSMTLWYAEIVNPSFGFDRNAFSDTEGRAIAAAWSREISGQ